MNPNSVLTYTILSIFAYLVGSIPSGFLLIRRFMEKDIREYGSGNIGATNVNRMAGLKFGLVTLVADAAKGALPVFLAWLATGNGFHQQVFMASAALAAFLGHLFPCFLRFKGGKGVSTAAGSFLVISPWGLSWAIGVFLAGALSTRRVSVGSLAAALALAPGVWWETRSVVFTLCAGILACLIIVRHAENLTRLKAGKEPRF
jgi:glycerol-3-phosphate acyltransferase PlsY